MIKGYMIVLSFAAFPEQLQCMAHMANSTTVWQLVLPACDAASMCCAGQLHCVHIVCIWVHAARGMFLLRTCRDSEGQPGLL